MMNKRLIHFLQAENISQSQFADTIGVARASISHILSGRNKPGYDFIESTLQHYPALNIEWLLTGKGRMYKNSEVASPKQEQSFQEHEELELFNSSNSSATTSQVPAKERIITKIIIYYSDNTFQEVK